MGKGTIVPVPVSAPAPLALAWDRAVGTAWAWALLPAGACPEASAFPFPLPLPLPWAYHKGTASAAWVASEAPAALALKVQPPVPGGWQHLHWPELEQHRRLQSGWQKHSPVQLPQLQCQLPFPQPPRLPQPQPQHCSQHHAPQRRPRRPLLVAPPQAQLQTELSHDPHCQG